MCSPPLQVSGDRIHPRKKRFDKGVKFLAGRRELKWTPLKQRRPKKFLQLGDLSAHRRLLDAVRHVAHRLGNAAVTGHVVKQLQVVNIHTSTQPMPRAISEYNR